MPTTTSAEQSLINGSEFLDELGQFSAEGEERAVQPLEQPTADHDGFDSLDSGLAMDDNGLDPVSRRFEPAPIEELGALPANLPAPDERRIPFLTAALVLLACLTAGAVTAAYVFQDRLTPVTVRPSAIR
jgi:hypothetical protein